MIRPLIYVMAETCDDRWNFELEATMPTLDLLSSHTAFSLFHTYDPSGWVNDTDSGRRDFNTLLTRPLTDADGDKAVRIGAETLYLMNGAVQLAYPGRQLLKCNRVVTAPQIHHVFWKNELHWPDCLAAATYDWLKNDRHYSEMVAKQSADASFLFWLFEKSLQDNVVRHLCIFAAEGLNFVSLYKFLDLIKEQAPAFYEKRKKGAVARFTQAANNAEVAGPVASRHGWIMKAPSLSLHAVTLKEASETITQFVWEFLREEKSCPYSHIPTFSDGGLKWEIDWNELKDIFE